MKCPGCGITFEFNDCLTDPGAKPNEGDVGVCYECETWWQMLDGKTENYEPTPEELELFTRNKEASRRRFELIGGREN